MNERHPDEARLAYDAQTAALVGCRLLDVVYWDLHNFSGEPREWDYGD